VKVEARRARYTDWARRRVELWRKHTERMALVDSPGA
jgi:hypothetical protein